MKITFYDTTEEMFDALQTAMEDADSEVKDWQKALKRGHCFRQETEYGFDIYGKVLEDNYEGDLQHYRFCFCFSEACPDGEQGDVHVSVVTELLDKSTFDEMYAGLNDGRKPPL